MIKIVLLFFILGSSFPSFANIEQYFKRLPKISSNHSFQNIDFVYLINLDQRPEKLAHCLEQLHPQGIFPYRLSAVNGWEISNEAIYDMGVSFDPRTMRAGMLGTVYLVGGKKTIDQKIYVPGRKYLSHKMNRGAVGILLSHLSILQHAYDSGFHTIWVMEDDIEIKKDPALLPELIRKLDRLLGQNGWDILFTDRDTKNRHGDYVPCLGYAQRPNFTPSYPERFQMRKKISDDFQQIGARYGAYSMILRRSGMEKVLNFLKQHQLFLPYDMEFFLPNDIRLFTVLEDVVSTKIDALSDNGEARYLKKFSHRE